MEISYVETVRNKYEVTGVDEDFFKPLSFKEGLDKYHRGNIWIMQSELSHIPITINKIECTDYIDIDKSSFLIKED